MSDSITFSVAENIEETVSLLEEYGDDAKLVSGGTALAILLRQSLVRPAKLISVSRIPELKQITQEQDAVRIGAAVPLRVVENHPLLRTYCPMLVETLTHVATPRIRNMATIGGGLAHADPSQDPVIALSVLGARVLVEGRTKRSIPVSEFCLDYYENALKDGELIVGVEVPNVVARTGASYIKFLPRSVEDYATVGAGAFVEVNDDGICRAARLVLGAVGPTPIVVDVTQALVGQQVTRERAQAAAELAYEIVDPMEDVRGSVEYKRDMAVVIGRRALLQAAERALSNR